MKYTNTVILCVTRPLQHSTQRSVVNYHCCIKHVLNVIFQPHLSCNGYVIGLE